MDLQWATSLASCLGFLFNYIPLILYRLFVNIEERLTDDYHVLFYFGVRVKVKDANESIFLLGEMQTGDFSFGVRIEVEEAKSLDLLHEFSLSVQTCLSYFAFKPMNSAYGEMQWQKLAEREKVPK